MTCNDCKPIKEELDILRSQVRIMDAESGGGLSHMYRMGMEHGIEQTKAAYKRHLDKMFGRVVSGEDYPKSKPTEVSIVDEGNGVVIK